MLDNGEPSFAILSYEMYKDLVLSNKEKEIKINHGMANGNGLSYNREENIAPKPVIPENELEILERINKDILALKSEIEKEEKMVSID